MRRLQHRLEIQAPAVPRRLPRQPRLDGMARSRVIRSKGRGILPARPQRRRLPLRRVETGRVTGRIGVGRVVQVEQEGLGHGHSGWQPSPHARNGGTARRLRQPGRGKQVMNLARYIAPAVVSEVVLAAHFLRSGHLLWVVASLIVPLLLLSRQRWALYVNQVALVAGAGMWLLVAYALMEMRREVGQPYLRMVLILGSVALIALVSAGLLAAPKVRERFR